VIIFFILQKQVKKKNALKPKKDAKIANFTQTILTKR
jgi:hypothetical protein